MNLKAYFPPVALLFVKYFHTGLCLMQCELRFVQILFRHGDRSPIHLYPTDPNTADFWTEGLGKLTLLGRKQHYMLGKTFRKLYKDFVSSSPLEVNVTSSESDRCRKSAETNLASFYEPSSKWQFVPDLKWQPIAINYVPEENDKFLETDSYCPAATKEEKNVVNSPDGKAFIAEHEAMFDSLSDMSGLTISDWKSASYLHDTLYIEKKYNLTIPHWAEDYWDELKNVSNLSFYWSFKSPLILRLRAGPLLGLINDNMNKKISGELTRQKVHIFSAHDTNIAVILQALNLFNMKQPPYCSSIVFELHECSSKYAVRILYFNSSTPEQGSQVPNVLILSGCSEYCPFEYFLNYTKKYVPEDWESECSLESPYFNTKTIISATVMSSVALCVIIVTYCLCTKIRQKRKESKEYSYHLMTLD